MKVCGELWMVGAASMVVTDAVNTDLCVNTTDSRVGLINLPPEIMTAEVPH